MIRRQSHAYSWCAPLPAGELQGARGARWALLRRGCTTMEAMESQQQSFYDAVGGAETFTAIVHRFYELVPEDEILNALYPADDLAGAEERLRMFLEQYWGGPRTYSDQRGHPRLRMRHVPFRITPIERDAWLRCKQTAVASVDSQTLDDAHRQQLLDYLEMAAHSLVNSDL